jgi:acyl-CoA synthetase (AMP-forming)/AMP-acid ligase II
LPGAVLSEAEVIDFVKEWGLAKYKWPEKIIFAPVPRNPAGKIEKPKLRELYVKPAQ